MILTVALMAGVARAGAPFGGKGLVTGWALDEVGGEWVARVRGPFGGHALACLDAGHKLTGADKGFPSGAAPGSISLWFNRPDGVRDKVLFSCGSPVHGGARGLWLVSESRLCFYFFGHPQDLHCDVKGGIAPDQWHHVAATFDGTTARLYYDGAPIGQVAPKIDTVLGGRFQVGANVVEDHRDFVGLLADVAVFDRALSADEIQAEFAAKAKLLAALPKDELRAWHAKRDALDAARRAELAAQTDTLGFEQIVFAVRQVDGDGHWYANFGYNIADAQRRLYYHDGGRLCTLGLKTGKAATLLDDPTGGVRDPQVHYDGRKILFSYRKGGQPYYHLYEISADGSGLRQLTDGPFDDIEPTYLPDGDIVFVSSRCNRWVPCYYTQVAILYRCDADGRSIRQLSANVEHENTPWVLPDGRILYQRWEYVDRSQIGYHHLWTMNPDGTCPMVFFGNQQPDTVMIDAKPIPGTGKVVASFSPGHGLNEHAGVITIVDPTLGPDAQPMARAVSKGGFYRDPYPLSEDSFLVAGETDILMMDGHGRTVRLFDLPPEWRRGTMKVHEPRPIRPRPRERVLPTRVDPACPTGEVFLEAVHVGRNMDGVKPGEVKKLLVLEILPKPWNMFSGMEPLTYGGTFLLERILGTVPVEADGSARFEVPALRPVFFIALDENDLAVKRMQSFMSVQPGESVGCVGCHENRTETSPALYPLSLEGRGRGEGGGIESSPPSPRPSLGGRGVGAALAMRRPPSAIEPIADAPDVFDFPRDIQPILDRHCLACHNYDKTAKGGPMAGGLNFAGDRGPMYSLAYYSLTISGELCDGRNLRKSNYPPRALGSGASPLLQRFAQQGATPHELKLLRLWIDTGAVYAGTYAALGTGSIGDYSGRGRPDLAWPSTKAAQAVLQRRCADCHKGKQALPASPSDDRGMVPWGEGPMNALALRESQRANPAFRFNRHLLYNLTLPEKSLLLRAPLAPEAGGLATVKLTRRAAPCPVVFKSTSDPDYQTLLRSIEEASRYLDEIKRFDMPGFKPRPEYVRELQRFGLLPAAFDPARDPLDVYAADRRYWRSAWYVPKQ